MTERKPPGVTWETWIDRQIRVGLESGAFDDLPGTGRPVPDLDWPRDEMWWVRDKVRREGVRSVPPAVAVRRELDATVAAIAEASSEAEVRRLATGINERVRWLNSRPVSGPPSTVAPLDVEAEVAAWRDVHPQAEPDPAATGVGAGAGDPGPPGTGDAAAAPRLRRRHRWRRRR